MAIDDRDGPRFRRQVGQQVPRQRSPRPAASGSRRVGPSGRRPGSSRGTMACCRPLARRRASPGSRHGGRRCATAHGCLRARLAEDREPVAARGRDASSPTRPPRPFELAEDISSAMIAASLLRAALAHRGRDGGLAAARWSGPCPRSPGLLAGRACTPTRNARPCRTGRIARHSLDVVERRRARLEPRP